MVSFCVTKVLALKISVQNKNIVNIMNISLRALVCRIFDEFVYDGN